MIQIPIHKRVENIENKLDEVLSYVKPATPVAPEPEELSLQDQLTIALTQIDGLRQALINQAQDLQTEVNTMQSQMVVEPLEEPLLPME